jgi:hypothetical protein
MSGLRRCAATPPRGLKDPNIVLFIRTSRRDGADERLTRDNEEVYP